MGQIPSINYEPFLVTLETVKVSERLAAVPLTKATVGDIDSPLFRMFYQARCDDAVRHWYCSPPSRDNINEPPTPEFIYRKFIEEPSIYLQASAQGDSPFTPVPIVLLKLQEPWTSTRQQPTMVDLCLGTGCEVIGYFGCRHFNADGSCDDYGVMGLFLTKAFHNEAKSVAILEIACKCYAYYSALEGLTQTPWPSEIRFSTLDSNLPCLRLMQKLLGGMGPSYMTAWSDCLEMEIDEEAKRFRCTVRGGAVRSFAEKLAQQVDDRLVVRTKSVDPAPNTMVHPILDAAVLSAKTKWAEANRAVHEHFHISRSSVASSSTPTTNAQTPSTNSRVSSEANTAPGTPTPLPITVNTTTPSLPASTLPSEPSTPVARSTRSNSTATQVLTMSYNDPYNNRQVYVSVPHQQQQQQPQMAATQQPFNNQGGYQQQGEVAHQYAQPQSHYVPQPVMGTPLNSVPRPSTVRDILAPKLHVPTTQMNKPNAYDISKPVILMLPKRTMISFWKKGAWLNAQWRCEDRYVRLAPIQHAADNGLLCLEAVGDNELDVSIFDEWSRPARLRLEQKQFYVAITAPQRIDSESGNNYPFFMDTQFQAIIQPAARPRSIYH